VINTIPTSIITMPILFGTGKPYRESHSVKYIFIPEGILIIPAKIKEP
jgi:hypothetical protein